MSWTNPRTTEQAPFISSGKFEKETVQNLNYLKDSVDSIDTTGVTTQRATSTSNFSTTGTTWANVTSMSLSVTVTTGQKILLMFLPSGIYIDDYLAEFQILRGTTQIKHAYSGQVGGDLYSAFNLITLDSPSAGTYTYKVQARTSNSGDTLTIGGDDTSPMELIAIKF